MSSYKASQIQLAKLSDLESILAIMDKANQYSLDKSGEPQWTAMNHARGELRTHLEQENCYVIKDKRGAINAIMTLTEEDTYAWGEEGLDQTALYFHKLMKDPESSLANPGLTLLSFAAREALRRGKSHLRCDTVSSMKRLISYYESLGFRIKNVLSAIKRVTGQECCLKPIPK